MNLFSSTQRHIFSLSLIALLGTGPAFAADDVQYVHTIDYNKLSANELEMLRYGIDLFQFTDAGAAKGKCITAIDYNKLSANELDRFHRGIDLFQVADEGATKGKCVVASGAD